MTEQEFKQGIAYLTSHGVVYDEITLDGWHKSLIKMDVKTFKWGIYDLCNTQEKFYPSDNIPALVKKYGGLWKKRQREKRNNLSAKNNLIAMQKNTDYSEKERGEIKKSLKSLIAGIGINKPKEEIRKESIIQDFSNENQELHEIEKKKFKEYALQD